MNPVIRTFLGKNINPFKIELEDIHIEDIAHALALCNRFAGHTKRPISVAQHSVYVSMISGKHYKDCPCISLVPSDSCNCGAPKFAKQGLLHDASEAYLGDVTKWIKHTEEMKEFRRIEDEVQRMIYHKFGCKFDVYPEVEDADRIMVRYEGKQGLGKSFKIDHPNYPPLVKRQIERVGEWDFWTWRHAEQMFLDHYRMLTENE